MTSKQWAADKERQKLFQTLINDPVMQEALSLVRDSCHPKSRTADDPAHITTLYALDYSRATGWYDCLSMLESLQRVNPQPDRKVSQPWTHKEDSNP